jgi:hypothetical protein
MATYNTTQSQDNNAPHGSHANWFGTVNHIASGESALFQNHQPGQPATHQFSFSPGSYATFPTQQYQNIGRLETHQPSHNAPAPEGDAAFRQYLDDYTNHAAYSEDAGDSSSREFAGNPAVDVNGLKYPAGLQQPSELAQDTACFQRSDPSSHHSQPLPPTLSDSHSPSLYSRTQTEQQSSKPTLNGAFAPTSSTSHEQQPMHSNIAHAPNVSIQHDASSNAACPRSFEHVPANGTSDRSGGSTQSNQESMPQTQTKPSGTKKRGISKVDGGRAASSSESPGADRAEKKQQRKTTVRKDKRLDFVPTAFGQGEYQDISIEYALERLTKKKPMEANKEHDDVESVVADKEYWVRAIMSSFDKPLSPVPCSGKNFGNMIGNFKYAQDMQYGLVMKEIDQDEVGDLVLAAATIVYTRIVDSHKNRNLVKSGCLKHDYKMTCSQRLKKCIEILEQPGIIRHDLITNTRIAEFIGDPVAFLKRKEGNQYDNASAGVRNAERKKLEEQQRESKSQDDSSESKRENEGSASSEVSMSGFDKDQRLDADSSDPGPRSVSD